MKGREIHLVSFSGGKDSTAMLLRMIEEGMSIDEIIFLDTGKEFPALYRHIDKVEKYINRKITRLQNPKGLFDYWMFDHIFKKRKRKGQKGKRKEQKGYGWPFFQVRWCTGRLKIDTATKYKNTHYKNIKTIEYHGIAYDEPKRIKKIGDRGREIREIRYPLVDWKMTEKDCLKYCYDRGFDWEGLYEHFDRLSCWCCPLQGLKDLKNLWKHYPELWTELKNMDERCKKNEYAYGNSRFRLDYTLEELEKRFQSEEENALLLARMRLF